jgi:hypothetical protein
MKKSRGIGGGQELSGSRGHPMMPKLSPKIPKQVKYNEKERAGPRKIPNTH